MVRRGTSALPRTAPCRACHRLFRVRNRVGIRFARSPATCEFLPAGVVCHYPFLGSALEQGAAIGLALLLVVWPRRLLRAALLHTAHPPRSWWNIARAGIRRSSDRAVVLQFPCSRDQLRSGELNMLNTQAI